MSTEKSIKEAVALKELGYSLREIAEQLGTSKSTVSRWLSNQESTAQDLEPDEFEEDETPVKRPRTDSGTVPGQNKSNPDHELGRLKLQYQHTENMADKEIKKRELTLKEWQQEVRNREIKEKEEARLEKKKHLEEKLDGRKKTLLNRFHRLIKTLKSTCSGYYWDTDETESYLAKVEKLKEEIEDFCDSNGLDYEELAIWNHLDIVEDWVNELIEEYQEKIFKSGNIYFDFDKDDIDQLKYALQVQDFEDVWEESEVEDEEEDNFDEDDEESDEDDDMEDDEEEENEK